ncbi:DUF805 domain-containing protein [Vibrio sp. ZSDE26]|uniref:DUF805 domain-containing protein n=1 Tax=Vibrio amylolyticus TaxID=2847292 RepID=A0A9X2BJ11_9VIBR|nr:DUF805 domain-containing protein [Vibrio amylolyticus]MCK6265264.1 DUF805 domain-containing protein [Vibrio amylolyticus]
MSIKQLLFSFEGRVGRKTYWIWNALYYAVIVGFAAGANVLFPAMAHIILPVFLLIVLVPDLAITAKRWHDRGKSSWWLLLNVPLVFGRMAVPAGDPTGLAQTSTIEMLISVAALICGTWILVECGFMKGEVTSNQYGDEIK